MATKYCDATIDTMAEAIGTDYVTLQERDACITDIESLCDDAYVAGWNEALAAVKVKKEEGMTIAGPDIQAFRAWWYAPKRKRVKADSSGFIGTDMCVCGHNWGGHILRGAPSDACGQCGCRSFRLATPEPPAEAKPGPWVATSIGWAADVDRDGRTFIHIAGEAGNFSMRCCLAERVASLLNESEVTG